METFYVTFDQFWDRFDNDEQPETTYQSSPPSMARKRMKMESNKPPRTIAEVEAVSKVNGRYIIMYGRHKPGKKTKVWEGDGYLTLVGQMAHLSDLRGRMLEDPIVLDDIDYGIVKDLGELVIGNTEVQVVDLDKR